MKEYIKPQLEMVDFTTEAITDVQMPDTEAGAGGGMNWSAFD